MIEEIWRKDVGCCVLAEYVDRLSGKTFVQMSIDDDPVITCPDWGMDRETINEIDCGAIVWLCETYGSNTSMFSFASCLKQAK